MINKPIDQASSVQPCYAEPDQPVRFLGWDRVFPHPSGLRDSPGNPPMEEATMDVSPPFRVVPIESVRALRVEGELDLATAPELDQLLGDAAAAGGPLVVDATGLSYMDSSGIHSLLHAAELVAQRGWCVYLHIDDGMVEEVLRLTGLDRMPHLHIIDHPGFQDPLQM